MQSAKNSMRLMRAASAAPLMQHPVRFFRKTVAPGKYNLRFRPSQGLDNAYIHYWANIHPANGFDASKTERNPNKFKYSSNLFRSEYQEWRMRAADYLY